MKLRFFFSSYYGLGDEFSYTESNKGCVRGCKTERPLLETARGRRSIYVISPVRKRDLIEVTRTIDGYENHVYGPEDEYSYAGSYRGRIRG